MDDEYSIRDFVNHVFDMMDDNDIKEKSTTDRIEWYLAGVLDDDEIKSPEDKFRDAVHERYIKDRCVALDSIKAGLP
jgi:hypothetical protein